MRFGKLLKEAVYNPHFSISYRKGFWRSIDVLSRTSESLIFIDDVSPAASGGYCDYEDLAVWGEGGLWGVSWVFIVLREMSHKHSWMSWLTEDSYLSAAQSSETSINKRTHVWKRYLRRSCRIVCFFCMLMLNTHLHLFILQMLFFAVQMRKTTCIVS